MSSFDRWLTIDFNMMENNTMEVNGYHKQDSSKSENSASVFNRSLLMLLDRSVWIVRYLQNFKQWLLLNSSSFPY